MPRYYFHIYQNGTFIRDEEGALCPDLETARREAMACATDLASQALTHVASADEICVEICDEEDQVLAGLTIRDILSSPDNPAFHSFPAGINKRLLH